MKHCIIVSDNHAGHMMGLTPPQWWRNGGELRKIQETFWNWWIETKQKKYDIMIHLGDIVDGEGPKDTTHHLTTDIEEQTEMAIEFIGSINAEKHKFVSGTPYHCGKALDYDARIAKAFNDKISWMRKLDIEGVKINAAHTIGKSTVPSGGYPQLSNQMIWNLIYSEIEQEAAADLILRGHAHEYRRVENPLRIAVICPALKIGSPDHDRYARKMQGGYYHVGFMELDIDNGEIIRLDKKTGSFKISRGYEKL